MGFFAPCRIKNEMQAGNIEIVTRPASVSRMNELNDNRGAELDELKTRLMKENAFLKMLASKPMSVCFDAYRTKAYDGGGEENLTFQVRKLKTQTNFFNSEHGIKMAWKKLNREKNSRNQNNLFFRALA